MVDITVFIRDELRNGIFWQMWRTTDGWDRVVKHWKGIFKSRTTGGIYSGVWGDFISDWEGVYADRVFMDDINSAFVDEWRSLFSLYVRIFVDDWERIIIEECEGLFIDGCERISQILWKNLHTIDDWKVIFTWEWGNIIDDWKGVYTEDGVFMNDWDITFIDKLRSGKESSHHRRLNEIENLQKSKAVFLAAW